MHSIAMGFALSAARPVHSRHRSVGAPPEVEGPVGLALLRALRYSTGVVIPLSVLRGWSPEARDRIEDWALAAVVGELGVMPPELRSYLDWLSAAEELPWTYPVPS